MAFPHRGIAALLQKAADEKEELNRSHNWMRDKVRDRYLAAAAAENDGTESKSARAAYRHQLVEGEKEKHMEEMWRRKEKEKESRVEMEGREERTSKELARIRHEADKENRMKQKVLANR